MNEKEAREIVKKEIKEVVASPIPSGIGHELSGHFLEARGYLYCLEQVKPLVEAIEKLSQHWAIIFPENNVIRSGSEYLMEKVNEALARWEKAQK